jgi:hypothetical protein
MLKFCSVTLESIAGFFLFFVTILGYMHAMPPTWRLIAALVCLVPFALLMVGGAALVRFQRWRRDVGVVLLVVTCVTVFSILSLWCMMMSEEFQRLMTINGPMPFGDYVFGTAMNAALAWLGWAMVRSDGVA